MIRSDKEFDDYGKQVLAPLRPVPPIDPQVGEAVKKQFLLQGENIRRGLISQPVRVDLEQRRRKPNIFWVFQRKPLMKTLVAVLLAVLVLLSGSSFTVYTAQSSLPGEPLYAIKSWSEDVRLSMTLSTKAKLNLTLDYTNRRVAEISELLAGGKVLNDQTPDRFQQELDNALQFAAQLDNTQIQNALGQIKSHAENQGMKMEELINTLPSQAKPAMIRLQARLAEQIQLSTFGESNPQAFRMQIRERLQKRLGPNQSPTISQPESTSPYLIVTPMDGQNGSDNGNNMNQPTDVPGHGGTGNGKGQSTLENRNIEPDPIRTPKP